MSYNNNADLNVAEKVIGYQFSDKSLLARAFTHSSYANEHKQAYDYERIEFLGDAVLDYIVGLFLYERFPTKKEGELSKIRAQLVSAETLSMIVEELDLVKYLRVGQGNVEEIYNSRDVKCDLFESIVGAILLDSDKNIEITKKFVLSHIEKHVYDKLVDYTSAVYEYCAKNAKKIEFVVKINDPTKPYFCFDLVIDDKIVTQGDGTSKQTAKRNACKVFYEKVMKQVD